MKQGRLTANKGLTLIELVVALSLVAIAAGAVVLSVKPDDRRALNNAALMLQSDMRYAQRMAMIENRRWGIRFDVAKNCYYVSPVALDFSVTTVPVYLPNGVLLEYSRPDMAYTPRGTVSHSFTILLRKGRCSQELTILPSSGRVEIKDVQCSSN